MKLHFNLPPTFFTHPQLSRHFERAASRFETSVSSADKIEDLLPHLRDADGVLMWAWPQFSPEILAQCERLRWAGFLDVGRETARVLLEGGVSVSLSRRAWSPAVAELALGLLLASLRKIPQHHASFSSRTENWAQTFPADIDPHERELSGMTVGIVGLGGIGARLAGLLAPFEGEILAFDPFCTPENAARVGAKLVELEELAQKCEAVVLCAATTPETQGLWSAACIEKMPRGAIFVNVSRWQNADGTALLARLQKREIYGAFDIFEPEPLPHDSILRELPNVVLTPHRGGGIFPSIHRHFEWLLGDFEAFTEGKPPKFGVNESILPLLG